MPMLLPSVLPPNGLSGKAAFGKYRIASKVCGLHSPAQFLSQVRRERMTVIQPLLGQAKLTLRIEHDEVGVVSRGEAAFPAVASRQLRGTFCHPPSDIAERKSPRARLGKHYRQSRG